MSDAAQSTIAQAVYATSQGCSFARVVTELERLLSRLRNTAMRTRWDYEDVVIFDLGETRIVMGWTEADSRDLPACLLVSVGPLPTAAPARTDPAHEVLCSRIVERILHRYPPEAVLWRQLPLAIEAELVDALMDCLPPLSDVLAGNPRTPDNNPRTPDNKAPTAADPAPQSESRVAAQSIPDATEAANDTPDLPRIETDRLARVRAALYDQPEGSSSETAQMRLAAQAMNATLIMVWMPLGAAVMTYSLLKGEKFGFSARMMAVTGTLLALSQTPFGQTVAAIAGV